MKNVDPRRDLQSVIDRIIDDGWSFEVLEAGCGSSSHVELGDRARITGIDISEEQLARNDRLDRKILGGVQTHDFDPECFELIVCWDVLEHLPSPEKALRSFARASMAGVPETLGFADGAQTLRCGERTGGRVFSPVLEHHDRESETEIEAASRAL